MVMNSVITSSVYGLIERMMFLSVFFPLIVVDFIFFTPFGGDAFLAVFFADTGFFAVFFAVVFFMSPP
jgi:hypothetical protein